MTSRPDWVYAVATTCPHCGRVNPHASGAADHPPRDGDWYMCGYCRGLGVFVVGPFGTAVRHLTEAEEAQARTDPKVRAALAALAESYTPTEATYLLRGTPPP